MEFGITVFKLINWKHPKLAA